MINQNDKKMENRFKTAREATEAAEERCRWWGPNLVYLGCREVKENGESV